VLLDHGASTDMNLKNVRGDTPLQIVSRAAYENRDSIIRLLLEHGVDVHSEDKASANVHVT
jgi:ankyrin repeat protein